MAAPALHAAPAVEDLAALQDPATKLVHITYGLSAAAAVSLEISSDGGATWTVPTTSASGDIGPSVEPGAEKFIVWNAATDWPENYSTQMRFRVVADGGEAAAPVGFASIPGGSFTMGVTSGDSDSNAPPVNVTVATFYMAETETAWSKWNEVRAWALTHDPPYTDLPVGGEKAANHPVHSVNWYDAVKWCNARSEMENLTPVYTVDDEVMREGTSEAVACDWSADGYRLPTEAEWEKAAMGGVAEKRFPWGGDVINHSHSNYSANGSAYAYDTSPYASNTYHPSYEIGEQPYTSPTGSFAANGYGLYDMSGNVGEWCWDRYTSSAYVEGAVDPRGPASGSTRVRRGGGWGSLALSVRCSVRLEEPPSYRGNSQGFRTARSSVSANGAETGDAVVDSRSAATSRPDVAAGASLRRLTGRHAYLPSRQLATLPAKKARPVTAYAAVANRGTLPDALAVRAKRGNAFFKVTYFAPNNATARLLSGRFRTAELKAGDAEVSIRVKVKPNKRKLTKKRGERRVVLKKTLNLPVTVWSVSGPGSDAATIRVRTR